MPRACRPYELDSANPPRKGILMNAHKDTDNRFYFLENGKQIYVKGVMSLLNQTKNQTSGEFYKIAAIKCLRDLFNIGLKEGKDMVDMTILAHEIAKEFTPR